MSAASSAVSFVDLIFHHALSQPEKPAIILPDRVATYDMIAQGILRVEDRIAALGLPAGGLVSLSFENPIRHLIVGSALFRLGHPIVSVTRPDQLAPLQLPVVAVMHEAGVAFIPGQRHVLVDDAWFNGERRPLAASPPKGFADEQLVCCVALSSGTTGHPKAISLTVKAFQQWVMNYYSTLGLGTWQRLLLLIGLNSSWGYTLAAHALFAGRTLTFAANARESLHVIAVYGVDALAATSVQLRELLKQQTRELMPCGSLRVILTGGGLAGRTMIADARARLCNSIVNLYGSTEAGGTAFAPCDRLDSEGATGFVAPWAEVEIVDTAGRPLPPGTDGILRIRATCQGAPFPPGTDNQSFRDGWFYPGSRPNHARRPHGAQRPHVRRHQCRRLQGCTGIDRGNASGTFGRHRCCGFRQCRRERYRGDCGGAGHQPAGGRTASDRMVRRTWCAFVADFYGPLAENIIGKD